MANVVNSADADEGIVNTGINCTCSTNTFSNDMSNIFQEKMMNFSTLEINKLESHYAVTFPIKYKKILALIGTSVVNISIKNISNKDIFNSNKNMSIYDIQDDMIDSVAQYNSSTSCNINVFFLTAFLRHTDCEYVAYFIEANGGDDCSVYCWIMDTAFDTDSIEKYSDNIEQWLYNINPILYIELQTRKLFYNVSTL